MADGGKISLHSTKTTDELTSFLKAAGFSQIELTENEVRALRAQWQAAGALLKRKKPEEVKQANPWAQLSTNNNFGVINEDELIKDST